MASIRQRWGRWEVRWRWPRGREGQERTVHAPDKATAVRLRAEVDRALALGHDWIPDDHRGEAPPAPRPLLSEILAAYLADVARVQAPSTARKHGEGVSLFARYLDATGAADDPATLTQDRLAGFWTWLRKTPGRGTSGAAVVTANRRVLVIQRAWAWASERDAYEDVVPRPRKIRLTTPPTRRPDPPTWAEMDACIRACSPDGDHRVKTGWHRRLALLLRYTGLRVDQAMHLRWDDVDLVGGTLRIRPELGKTAQERRGRVVPLSPHLVAELAGWGRRVGWLIQSGRQGLRERQARPRDLARAWARAGVRPEVWASPGEGSHGKAHHAFRGGFQFELARAGVAEHLLDYLVGHAPATVRDRHYRSPTMEELREAVAKIPPVGGPPASLDDRRRGLA